MKLEFEFVAVERVRREVEAKHPHAEELHGGACGTNTASA